jgi:hypothetical protein
MAETKPDALLEVERMNRAYAAVFGEEGRRTTMQEAVWADLAMGSFEYKSMVQVTADGVIDPLRLAWNDGRRSMFLYIRESIRRATTPSQPTQVTVKKE